MYLYEISIYLLAMARCLSVRDELFNLRTVCNLNSDSVRPQFLHEIRRQGANKLRACPTMTLSLPF